MAESTCSARSDGHPHSLDFLLSAGVPLTRVPRMQTLAEEVLGDGAGLTDRERRAAAFKARWEAAEVFMDRTVTEPVPVAMHYLWVAELHEDSDLRDRFRDSLPRMLVARCEAIASGEIVDRGTP